MALASRRRASFQRGGLGPATRRPRWLLGLAALVTAVVLLGLFVSLRTPHHDPKVANLAYLDQVRPAIESSNQEGLQVAQVRAGADQLKRDGVERQLAIVVADADRAAARARAVKTPADLGPAHDLLLGTLSARATAAREVRTGLSAALGTEAADVAVGALVNAGQDLAAADRSYRLFTATLPPSQGPPPASAWVANAVDWSPQGLEAYVASLRSRVAPTPVHDLAVLVATSDPASVGTKPVNGADVTVVPNAKAVSFQVAVANRGNATESRVVVTATLAPTGAAPESRRSDYLQLVPGQNQVVQITGFRTPAVGLPFVVAVRVSGPVQPDAVPANDQIVTTYVAQ